MIDLTNKSIDGINTLIQKYRNVLELIKPDDVPYMAVIVDTGISCINLKYKQLPIDWKCWAIVMLKELYYKKRIQSEDNISSEIDRFIEYLNKNYKEYCDLKWSGNEYERDRGFVYEYLKKRG